MAGNTVAEPRRQVLVYGGPHDGMLVWVPFHEVVHGAPPHDYVVKLNGTMMPAVEDLAEDYIYVKLPNDGDWTLTWRGFQGDWVQDAIHAYEQDGPHDWGPWGLTPRGNRLRTCRLCGRTEARMW